MIRLVLAKATFNSQYGLSYFANSEKLLGINENLDPLVFEYIHSYIGLLDKVGVHVPNAEVIADTPDDTYAFAILPFTDESDWNDFLSSREMSNFLNAVNNLYPQLGWTFNGFKVINSVDEPLVKTKFEIEKIWNSN